MWGRGGGVFRQIREEGAGYGPWVGGRGGGCLVFFYFSYFSQPLLWPCRQAATMQWTGSSESA